MIRVSNRHPTPCSCHRGSTSLPHYYTRHSPPSTRHGHAPRSWWIHAHQPLWPKQPGCCTSPGRTADREHQPAKLSAKLPGATGYSSPAALYGQRNISWPRQWRTPAWRFRSTAWTPTCCTHRRLQSSKWLILSCSRNTALIT